MILSNIWSMCKNWMADSLQLILLCTVNWETFCFLKKKGWCKLDSYFKKKKLIKKVWNHVATWSWINLLISITSFWFLLSQPLIFCFQNKQLTLFLFLLTQFRNNLQATHPRGNKKLRSIPYKSLEM